MQTLRFVLLVLLLVAPAAAQEPSPSPAPPAGGAQQALDPASLPTVVARVFGQEIPRDQLVREAEAAREQLERSGRRPVMNLAFYRTALDQILAGLLLSAEAKELGIAATNEQLQQRLAEVKARVGDDAGFAQLLESEGLSEEGFLEELRRTVSIDNYLRQQIAPQVTISEEQARAYYDQNLERMSQPELVRVRHILILAREGLSDEERAAARARIEAIRKRIEDGEDFATVAAETTEDEGSKETGGELPWFSRGQTRPGFEEAVFALDVGQLSGIVETSLGFHVVELLERRPATTLQFEQVQDRISSMLQSQAVQVEMHRRVQVLKTKAGVEIFLE